MEFALRFLVGGVVVSLFALAADVLKPKSFAGLLGAAPSVAPATITLTAVKDGAQYAAMEARAMILGAAAFTLYASLASRLLSRGRWSAFSVTTMLPTIWTVAALGLWRLLLG